MNRGKTDIVLVMAATLFIGKHEREDLAPLTSFCLQKQNQKK